MSKTWESFADTPGPTEKKMDIMALQLQGTMRVGSYPGKRIPTSWVSIDI